MQSMVSSYNTTRNVHENFIFSSNFHLRSRSFTLLLILLIFMFNQCYTCIILFMNSRRALPSLYFSSEKLEIYEYAKQLFYESTGTRTYEPDEYRRPRFVITRNNNRTSDSTTFANSCRWSCILINERKHGPCNKIRRNSLPPSIHS